MVKSKPDTVQVEESKVELNRRGRGGRLRFKKEEEGGCE